MGDTTLGVVLGAAAFVAQYGRLSAVRLLDVTVSSAVAVGSQVIVNLQVEGLPLLPLFGAVVSSTDRECQVRVNLTATDRKQLEDCFRRLKGGTLPRQEPRYPTVFEVSVEGHAHPEFAQNLSRGGLFIATPAAPPIGSAVRIRLKLPNMQQPMDTQAKVSWAGVDQATGKSGVGVQFVDPPPQLLEEVARYLAALKQRPAKRALVADDDEIVRTLLTDLLQRQGYEVVQAATGNDALAIALAQVHNLQLVLLDLVMPGMDGFDVLTQIREPTDKHNVPIIVVTGSDIEKATCARELGADAAVMKGFEGDELLALIESVMTQRQSPPTP